MSVNLGPHFLAGGDDATIAWLKLKPSVAKFCWSGYELAALANASTLTIGRPEGQFIGQHPLGVGDPVQAAALMAQQLYAPLVAAYPAIKAWEGPNEVGVNADEWGISLRCAR